MQRLTFHQYNIIIQVLNVRNLTITVSLNVCIGEFSYWVVLLCLTVCMERVLTFLVVRCSLFIQRKLFLTEENVVSGVKEMRESDPWVIEA